MCDLAYVNLLREKVRQFETEQKRLETFGPSPSVRFVPFMAAQSASLRESADSANWRDTIFQANNQASIRKRKLLRSWVAWERCAPSAKAFP